MALTDQEIRIACIQHAAATPGNPNTVTLAREYYAFVTETPEAPKAATAAAKGSKKQ